MGNGQIKVVKVLKSKTNTTPSEVSGTSVGTSAQSGSPLVVTIKRNIGSLTDSQILHEIMSK